MSDSIITQDMKIFQGIVKTAMEKSNNGGVSIVNIGQISFSPQKQEENLEELECTKVNEIDAPIEVRELPAPIDVNNNSLRELLQRALELLPDPKIENMEKLCASIALEINNNEVGKALNYLSKSYFWLKKRIQ